MTGLTSFGELDVRASRSPAGLVVTFDYDARVSDEGDVGPRCRETVVLRSGEFIEILERAEDPENADGYPRRLLVGCLDGVDDLAVSVPAGRPPENGLDTATGAWWLRWVGDVVPTLTVASGDGEIVAVPGDRGPTHRYRWRVPLAEEEFTSYGATVGHVHRVWERSLAAFAEAEAVAVAETRFAGPDEPGEFA